MSEENLIVVICFQDGTNVTDKFKLDTDLLTLKQRVNAKKLRKHGIQLLSPSQYTFKLPSGVILGDEKSTLKQILQENNITDRTHSLKLIPITLIDREIPGSQVLVKVRLPNWTYVTVKASPTSNLVSIQEMIERKCEAKADVVLLPMRFYILKFRLSGITLTDLQCTLSDVLKFDVFQPSTMAKLLDLSIDLNSDMAQTLVMEGKLMKARKIVGWHERYFELTPTKLSWSEKKGQTALNHASVEDIVVREGKQPKTFDIEFKDKEKDPDKEKDKVISLMSKSQEETDDWVLALDTVIQAVKAFRAPNVVHRAKQRRQLTSNSTFGEIGGPSPAISAMVTTMGEFDPSLLLEFQKVPELKKKKTLKQIEVNMSGSSDEQQQQQEQTSEERKKKRKEENRLKENDDEDDEEDDDDDDDDYEDDDNNNNNNNGDGDGIDNSGNNTNSKNKKKSKKKKNLEAKLEGLGITIIGSDGSEAGNDNSKSKQQTEGEGGINDITKGSSSDNNNNNNNNGNDNNNNNNNNKNEINELTLLGGNTFGRESGISSYRGSTMSDCAEEDRSPIILDTGSWTSKAGFGGYSNPTTVVPSICGRLRAAVKRTPLLTKSSYIGFEALQKKGVLSLRYPMENGVVNDWDEMERLWSHVFIDTLRVMPDEYPILLSEPEFASVKAKTKSAEIMFESFNVPELLIASQPILSVFGSQKTTALIIDIGESGTRFVPVWQGTMLKDSIQRSPIAGRKLTEYMARLLSESETTFSNQHVSTPTSSEYRVVSEIKENFAYTALNFQSELQAKRDPIDFTLPDDRIMTFSSQRFRCPEALFDPSVIGIQMTEALPAKAYDAISSCAIDLRRDLFENIILIGGGSQIAGLPERLIYELEQLAPPSTKINVTVPEDPENILWKGGSLMSTFEALSNHWITADVYEEYGADIFSI